MSLPFKARVLDNNIIYVNLSGADTSPRHSADGTPKSGYWLFMTWFEERAIGTEENPLSYAEFKAYLKNGIDNSTNGGSYREFRITGEVHITQFLADYEQPILDMRYDEHDSGYNRQVRFVSWFSLTESNQPYVFDISAQRLSKLPSYVNGANPQIYFVKSAYVDITFASATIIGNKYTYVNDAGNAMVTSEIGMVQFIDVAQTISARGVSKANMYFTNCRVSAFGGGRYRVSSLPNTSFLNGGFSIDSYIDVRLLNSLFIVRGGSSNLSVLYMADNRIGRAKYTLMNTLFLGISSVRRITLSTPSASLKYVSDLSLAVAARALGPLSVEVLQSVFSQSTDSVLSDFTSPDTHTYNLVLESEIDPLLCQYSFPVPFLNDPERYVDFVESDFIYTTNGWELINVAITVRSGLWLGVEYGHRDGPGALVFPQMAPLYIEASAREVTTGDHVSIYNIDHTYDTTYKPSHYVWDIGGDEVTTIAGGVVYDASHFGEIEISAKAYSYNSWYYMETMLSVYVTVKYDIDWEVSIVDSHGRPRYEFPIFSEVAMKIKATTPNGPTDGYVGECGVNWGDNDRRSSYSLSKAGTVNVFLNDLQFTHNTYDSVGPRVVVFVADLPFRGKYLWQGVINIIDNYSMEYYVDLSEEYEQDNWLDYNYGVFDTFESGAISSQLNPAFSNSYVVKDLWGDKSATGDQLKLMYDLIGYDDYAVEVSLVRSVMSDEPTLVIMHDDVNYAKIAWDYTKHSIIVTPADNSSVYIKYPDHGNDLSCNDSLRTVYVNCVYDVNDSMLKLSYKLTYDGDWIYTGVDIKTEPFVNAKVYAYCTLDSGYGYVKIQHNTMYGNSSNIIRNGTEEHPYTYHQMLDKMRDENTGVSSRFLCRYDRTVVEPVYIPTTKYYEIDAWDPDKYGPWMMQIKVRHGKYTVNFGGVSLSNGILYSSVINYTDVKISRAFDMFITINGGRLILDKYPWKYTKDDVRTDIVGCTIRANKGDIIKGKDYK